MRDQFVLPFVMVAQNGPCQPFNRPCQALNVGYLIEGLNLSYILNGEEPQIYLFFFLRN